MKSIIFALLLFALGCAPADPSAVADANGDITQNGTVENGRLTLPYEALKISDDSTSAANAFYARVQDQASSVVKEYFFTTPPALTTYTLQFDGVNYMSCDTNPQGRFYLIDGAGHNTQVSPYVGFQLPANTNYRLQFRSDNLNCYSIKVSFVFKRL